MGPEDKADLALQEAREAKSAIETHERVCIEKHNTVIEKLVNLSGLVEKLYDRWWKSIMWALGSLGLAVVSLIVYIYMKGH